MKDSGGRWCEWLGRGVKGQDKVTEAGRSRIICPPAWFAGPVFPPTSSLHLFKKRPAPLPVTQLGGSSLSVQSESTMGVRRALWQDLPLSAIVELWLMGHPVYYRAANRRCLRLAPCLTRLSGQWGSVGVVNVQHPPKKNKKNSCNSDSDLHQTQKSTVAHIILYIMFHVCVDNSLQLLRKSISAKYPSISTFEI